MKRRRFLAATSALAAPCVVAFAQDSANDDEQAIRAIVRHYVDAREAEDPKALEPLFTPDADQLVSDGTWRRGRDELVKGMLESSRKNPAKRSVEVATVRLISADVAVADGRYVQKGRDGAKDREMWTAITLKRAADGWRIAAIRNMLPAAPEPVPPAAELDPQAVLNEAVSLARRGMYEEALQKHLWFHENALKIRPSLVGVRLSFALSYWVDLGRKYPKARKALVEIRDRDIEAMKADTGTVEVFSDVASISDFLGEPAKAIDLFKWIDTERPRLAGRCYIFAEGTLAAAGEYALCSKYIPDADAKFRREKTLYESNVRWYKSQPNDPRIPDTSGPMFAENICRLIEILVGAGRKPEAEKIRRQALEVLDDQRIRDAIEAVEAKQGRQ